MNIGGIISFSPVRYRSQIRTIRLQKQSLYDNVTVINEDVLKVDLKKLADEMNDGKPVKVVANLP